MKTEQMFVVLAAVVGWFAVAAIGFESDNPHLNSEPQVYCGRRLASTLSYLCDGLLVKRSSSFSPNSVYEWPWLPAQRARAMGRGKRQGTIIAECCEKACTVDELLTYCN